MDPLVQVALVSTLGVVVAAWLTRPTIASRKTTRQTHQAVRRVEEQFENNHGTSAKDAWDRIETSIGLVATDLAHLRGRFDQHLNDTTLARRERIGMWSAVEAVAQSEPPTEGDRNG